MRASGLLTLFCLVLGCRAPSLSSVADDVEVPPSLNFGTVVVGTSQSQTLLLTNRGRGPAPLTLTTEAPFSVPTDLVLAGGTSATIEVTFSPHEPGDVAGTLRVAAQEGARLVELRGQGVLQPSCAAGPCQQAHFDGALGCVLEPQDDGAACADPDQCITAGVCLDGICRVSTPPCDDDDACSVDACSNGQCTHAPVSCPGSEDPCLAAFCESKDGCGLRPVDDGVACGINDCVTAKVCLSGSCVERPAPEGSQCGAFSLCNGHGRCVEGSCSPTGPETVATWAPPPGFSVPLDAFDSAGNLYLAAVEEARVQSHVRLVSLDANGVVRFDLDLSAGEPRVENASAIFVDEAAQLLYVGLRNWRLVADADRFVSVQARDLTTGALVWQVDLTAWVRAASPSVYADEVFALLASDGGVVVSLGCAYFNAPSHAAYVLALSAQGDELWHRYQEGHQRTRLSGDGSLWSSWSACWSPDWGSSRWQGPTRLAEAINPTYSFQAMGTASSVATAGDGGVVLIDRALQAQPLPIPDGTTVSGVMLEADGLVTASVTITDGGQNAIVRTDSTSGVRWVAPLPWSPWSGVLLEDGGVLLNGGASQVAVIAGDGAVGERCEVGQVAGLSHERLYAWGNYRQSLQILAAPGLRTAPHGWIVSSGDQTRGQRPR